MSRRPDDGTSDPRAAPRRPHILELLPEELAAYLRQMGSVLSDGEARRILAHAASTDLQGFPVARPVSGAAARAVAEHIDRQPLLVLARVTDATDGFVRYLFQSPDGARSEAVRIPLEVPGRFTVCLSCQVGCALGCAFCMTGRLGLQRPLEAWEMVAAFRTIRTEAPGHVKGAVFMGQGEPMLNLPRVLRAARWLCHPCGGRVRAEAISLSTAGIVPALRRYSDLRLPYRLVVSLTSALPERRAALMPGAARYSLGALARAVRRHARMSGERVTLAWVVLGGVNTGPEEVEALRRLFPGTPLRLALIDVNDPRPDGFRRATQAELDAFRDRLRTLGIPVVRRYSGGASAHAACGMLAGSMPPSTTEEAAMDGKHEESGLDR